MTGLAKQEQVREWKMRNFLAAWYSKQEIVAVGAVK